MPLELFFFPFVVLFGLLSSLVALVVIIYAIYDVLVNQKHLPSEEKVIWIIFIILLNFLGAVIYLIVARTDNLGILDFEDDLSELEKLKDLKDKDAITDEEYTKMKEKILEDYE